jgi:molybdopterin synthase catalytic subunit
MSGEGSAGRTSPAVARLAITSAPLDPAALVSAVDGDDGTIGAVVTFLGLVRGTNQGRHVVRLEYEAYDPLALRGLERIADEVATTWPAVRLGIHHRTGLVPIGEASVAIVSASPHRAEAYAASRYAIERVKQILPVWKHEYFETGDVWIEGATADPDDERARGMALERACTSR